MGAEYISRHAALAGAVNVAQACALNEAGVAVPITVPAGKSRIVEVWATISASIVAVASAGTTIRLVASGNGIKPEQHITIGGIREDTTSTAGMHVTTPTIFKVDWEVIPSNVIDLNLFTAGVDSGTPEVDITLVFA